MELEPPIVNMEIDLEEDGKRPLDPKHQHLYLCLGEVIRDRRKALELSQSELAANAGIDRAFLSNLERGQRKPSFGTVARIARGLKIKYSRLVAKCEKCLEERSKKTA